MSFLKIHIFCGYVTAQLPVRRPIDYQRPYYLDEKRKLKTSCLILSSPKNNFGIWESESIIVAITIIALISIIILMLKIDWEKVFEKYVGEGEREIDESDS